MKLIFLALSRRASVLIVFETILIGAAVFAAAWALGESWDSLLLTNETLLKAFLIAAVCQVCLYFADLYNTRVIGDRRELFVGLVQALGAASLLLAGVYFWFPSLIIGRGVFMVAALMVVGLVAGWRAAFEWVSRHAANERLLLVGTGPGAVLLARELFERRQALGLEIVGFVDPDPARVGTPLINPGIVGTIDDIPTIARERGVTRVVVSLSDARGKLPMDKLLEMKLDGISFDHLASVYEELTGKIAVENLRPSWLIFSSGFRKSRLLEAQKRLLDVTVASVGLILAAPILLLVTLAVRLTSPGPALFRQQRVGRHGRVFTVNKFRSMRQDAEKGTGAVWAQENDPRVTPVGRFLRQSRLDEIPQLWNVLAGDMSLVGPRPERPEFVTQLTTQIPFYGQRHVVRPGLTGWAQVRYRYGSTVEDAMEKLQYDLFYIKNLSIALDLFIIVSTIKTVILRQGS